MLNEHIPFFKTIRVEQDFDAFAGAELTAIMLRIDAALSATQAGRATFLFQLINNVMHEHILLDTGVGSGLATPEAWEPYPTTGSIEWWGRVQTPRALFRPARQ